MADHVKRDNVVKKEDLSVTAVPFQFQDVQALAKQILQKANQQSQRIIDAARKQAEDIEKAAFDDGKEKGFREGFEQGQKEGHAAGEKAARGEVTESAQTLGGMLETLIEELANERLVLRNNAEVDLLSLALAIAGKVVRRQIMIDPEVIVANVEAVIGLTVSRRDIALHVNPMDYDAVEDFLPTLHERFSDLGRVSLVRSEKVERGGVRAVTPEGEVDIQIAEQLKALERALLGEGSESKEADEEVIKALPEEVGNTAGVEAIREAAEELRAGVDAAGPDSAGIPSATAEELAATAGATAPESDNNITESDELPAGEVDSGQPGVEIPGGVDEDKPSPSEQDLQTEPGENSPAAQAEKGAAGDDSTDNQEPAPPPEGGESPNSPDSNAS